MICGGINANLGGTDIKILPEVSPVNYVPRINVPTLMLNSKYDYVFLFENHVKPFYNLLGTSEKKLVLYETGHFVPKNEMIKEVLAWCDKYLGPVK